MAEHKLTFPASEEDIRKLHAGDLVTVDGHILGIRDRTQIRIFDQGVEPPLDLNGAFLLHTAPNVRKLGPGKYEPMCVGTTTSARMVRFTEPLGATTACARSPAKAGSPTRRSSRWRSTGWSTSRSSGAPRRSRRRRSRRSKRSTGRSSCPSASGSSELETSARSGSGSTRTATRCTETSNPKRRRDWRRSLADFDGFLDLPARAPKPRHTGLTHVIDKGLNLRDIEGLFDTAGDYVDVVKLGWGTSYVTRNLEKKIALYRSFETPVVCGGTLFEAVVARGKVDEYKTWLVEQRLSHVEISDGAIEIPRERKLELIADFARDFTVLSEVGSKDSEVNYAPYLWVQWSKEELEAGAWKVVTEGREGGTAGIYRPTGEMRTGLVDEIAHEIDV